MWIRYRAVYCGCETDREFGFLYTKYSRRKEWFTVLPEAGHAGDMEEYGEKYRLRC
jgi:hypothetical protein